MSVAELLLICLGGILLLIIAVLFVVGLIRVVIPAIRLICGSEDETEARDAARRIGDTRPKIEDIDILGPAPAPMALLRGRYRYRLLVNARRSARVQDAIRDWLAPLDLPRGVRVSIDIDPYSFV